MDRCHYIRISATGQYFSTCAVRPSVTSAVYPTQYTSIFIGEMSKLTTQTTLTVFVWASLTGTPATAGLNYRYRLYDWANNLLSQSPSLLSVSVSPAYTTVGY
jgi:hypothetical protein